MKDQKKNVKKWKRVVKKIIIWLVVLLILAGAGLYAYESLRNEYRITYQSYTVTRGSISNSLSFSGSMQVIDSKTYSNSAQATVRNVYVATGDEVKKGDKLIRLSTGDTLTADFDGKVNQLYVEKDDELSAGTQLLQLVDFVHMKVSVRVDEYDIADVHVGDQCTITATATEKKFSSTIDNINYVSSSGGSVAYYTATIYVDVDSDSGVYPGMQVTVTVPQEQAENVIILKEDALSFGFTNEAYVYMQNESGEMTEVSVELGVSNGNYVEIKSGLNEGDEVFVEVEQTETASGLASLFSGMFGSTSIQGGRSGRGSGSSSTTGSFDFSSGSMPDMSSMPSGGFSGGGTGGMGGGGMP